jgi:predicted DNA-binding transcriptional regulator YafY
MVRIRSLMRIRSLKDSNDQEKIGTQRQDLLDNWEQDAEKHPTINKNDILYKREEI